MSETTKATMSEPKKLPQRHALGQNLQPKNKVSKLSDTLKEMGVGFTFPIQIKNAVGKETYFENINGYWHKSEYDSAGRLTCFKNGDGFWRIIKYNSAGKETYREDSNGYWRMSKYDSKGNETYREESNGYWCSRGYDSEGNETYFENSGRYKKGTPRSAETCEGKVVEVDGVKYELKTINN